ncbi:MAG: DUF1499 domain-containing protein [Gammaproteobacteria bacterium]|nr:DUF1499 domain-containing protein [Gammaproteobacteria bacterium]
MSEKKRYSISSVLSVVIAVVAIGMAVIAVKGYRSGELHFVTTLKDFETASYVAVIAFVISLLSLWFVRPAGNRRGLLPGLLGLALSLPLVFFIVNFEYAAGAYPPINDITTDTEDAPNFWDVPNPVIYPGGKVAELQKKGYPDLKHLEVTMDIDKAFKLASDVAKGMGWEIIVENDDDMQIEAVDTSSLFGFKDNVVIRLQESGDNTRVDVRSHSRLGKIDRGVNARRIRKYMHELELRIAEA